MGSHRRIHVPAIMNQLECMTGNQGSEAIRGLLGRLPAYRLAIESESLVSEWELTDWERRGFGVIAAAARADRSSASDPVASDPLDSAVVLHAALPLVQLPAAFTATCSFTIDPLPGSADSTPSASLWTSLRGGRVQFQGHGRMDASPNGAQGHIGAWDRALCDNDPAGLTVTGDNRLVEALLEQLHDQLFRY